MAGIGDLGILDLGVEAMPGAFDPDESMPDAGAVEGLRELLGLRDGDPGIERAVDDQHGSGIAADAVDGGGLAGSGRLGHALAQEDVDRFVGQAPGPVEREPLEVGRAVEVDDRLDAGGYVVRMGRAEVPRSAARWAPADCPNAAMRSGSIPSSSACRRVQRTASRRSSRASGQDGDPGRASR